MSQPAKSALTLPERPILAAAKAATAAMAPPIVRAIPGNITIGIPWQATGPSFVPKHLDGVLSPGQGRALRAIRNALLERGVELQPGREIKSTMDVIRWMLDRAGEGIAKP